MNLEISGLQQSNSCLQRHHHQRTEQLRWSQAIASVASSDDLADLLQGQCDLLTGGCLLFALALEPLFIDGCLACIWRGRPSAQPVRDHVVLQLRDGSTLDAHGWLDADQLLAVWSRLYRPQDDHLFIKPVTLSQCLASGCGEYERFGGATAVAQMTALLKAERSALEVGDA